MQVDPIKPKFKPPGSKRLKLKCDVLLSNFALKFNLRRYTKVNRGVEQAFLHIAKRLIEKRAAAPRGAANAGRGRASMVIMDEKPPVKQQECC